jgi:TRAP-type mannitol/chloroaromatic compound transport system permease large subunit
MKGVCPQEVSMADIYRAALPFLGCDLIIMVLMMVFPQLVMWLPALTA